MKLLLLVLIALLIIGAIVATRTVLRSTYRTGEQIRVTRMRVLEGGE